MPVLLMARGDQESRNLLRHAIEARYGLGPPVIETLKLEFKGRTRTKIGPVTTGFRFEGVAYFKFPFSVRWNMTTRSVGVSLSTSAEAFDGATLYRRRNRDPLITITDASQADSLRTRLWALCAVMLTPLAEYFVQLTATSEHSFTAVNTDAGIQTELSLTQEGALNRITTECIHPVSGKLQPYHIQLSEEQALFGSLILPRKISLIWDDEPEMDIAPVTAEVNQTIAETLFTLESD